MTNESMTSPALSPGESMETTLSFLPKFGSDGLIPAIVTDVKSGNVLMFAHMNEEALRQTIEHRRRAFLEPLPRQALEKGRGERQSPQGERSAHRLRSGRFMAGR